MRTDSHSLEGIPCPSPVRFVWVAPVALSAAFAHLSGPPCRCRPPTPHRKNRAARTSVEAEVKYVDDSTHEAAAPRREAGTITKHGLLQVAVADIRASSSPTDPARRGREDRARHLEARTTPTSRCARYATADLKAFRERAYPSLLKATKSDDPEISRRATRH